jgi:hypothetical protein
MTIANMEPVEPEHRGRWSKPNPLGYGTAMDSLGTVACPLLAGFSFASVIVIADDSLSFRWPGVGILALSIAAISFFGALEASFNSKRYIWSPGDVSEWWPEIAVEPESAGHEGGRTDGSYTAERLRNEQRTAFGRWRKWAGWSRRFYNCGVLALLFGLSSAIAPPPGAHGATPRWISVGVVFAAFIVELAWIVTIGIRRR